MAAPAAAAARPWPGLFAFALALYMLVIVGRIHEIVPFLARVYLGKVSALVLIGAAALQVSRINFAVVFKSTVGRCLIAITLLAILSIPGSFWPRQSVMFFQNWPLALLGVACVLAGFEDPRTARLVIAALTIAAGIAAVMLLIGGGLLTGDRAYIGGASSTYDPNQTAALFVMMLPYAIMFATRPGVMRWLALPIIPALVAAMMKTGSRGGVLAFGATCIAIVAFSYGRQRKWYVLLLGAAVLTMLAMPHSALLERFNELTGGGDYNFSSRDGRWPIWVRSMKLIATHPVVGVGVGAYEVANGVTAGSWKAAHNSFLEIGAELGVFGLVAFVLAIAAAFKSAWSIRQLPPRSAAEVKQGSLTAALATATLCSLVGLLAASIFLSLQYQSMTLFALAAPTALAWSQRRAGSPARSGVLPARQSAAPAAGWRSARVQPRPLAANPGVVVARPMGRGRRLK